MKILRDEDGQVLAVAVCSAAMLMGLIGLAVDVSMLFRAERQAQTAADAAAVAGALELHYNGSTNVSTNAVSAAEANGITSANQVSVSTNGGGYHKGSGFVQVIINQPNPTIFMHTMSQLMNGNNWGSVNVSARAVAGITPDPSCIYLLDPSVSGALSTKGAATVDSAGCGIEVNSTSNTSVCITGAGNNLTFDAPYVRLRTTALTTQGNCNGSLTTPTFTGASNVSDPLGGITGPTSSNSYSGCDYTSSVSSVASGDATTQLSGYHTICFSNFVQIGSSSGNSTVNLSNATAYVFENGVEILNGTTVNSSGTFDITGGSQKSNGGASCIGGGNSKTGFLQDSSSELYITAPSSGFSTGIAIMEPSGDTDPLEVQFGSNSSSSTGSGTLSGLIYAPSAPVYLHDNGGGTTATGLIADTLNVCSSTLNITSYNNAPNNASPLNSIQLVE